MALIMSVLEPIGLYHESANFHVKGQTASIFNSVSNKVSITTTQHSLMVQKQL